MEGRWCSLCTKSLLGRKKQPVDVVRLEDGRLEMVGGELVFTPSAGSERYAHRVCYLEAIGSAEVMESILEKRDGPSDGDR